MRYIVKLFLIIIIISLVPSLSYGQSNYTTVTATISDPQGTLYAGASYNIIYVPSPSATQLPTINGSQFQLSYQGFLDSNGSLSISIPSSTSIVDSHTGAIGPMWKFIITTVGISIPTGTGPQSFNAILSITGSTLNISSTLNAGAPTLIKGTFNTIQNTVSDLFNRSFLGSNWTQAVGGFTTAANGPLTGTNSTGPNIAQYITNGQPITSDILAIVNSTVGSGYSGVSSMVLSHGHNL